MNLNKLNTLELDARQSALDTRRGVLVDVQRQQADGARVDAESQFRDGNMSLLGRNV